jgi:exodeoxyribonuclease VII large subunit
VVPDVAEEHHKIAQLRQRIFMRVDTFVSNQTELVAQFRNRPILANPFTFIDERATDIDRWLLTMRDRLGQYIDREFVSLGHLRQQVRSLSPQSTLDRGYSVVRDADGHVLSDASKVKSGQKLSMRLAKGELQATAD